MIAIKSIYGNIEGLKRNQLHRIQRIYRRRIPERNFISPELARYISELSWEIGRQIGLMVDRGGNIEFVVVGDTRRIVWPDLSRYRMGIGRLRGLRILHTHLAGELLTRDDLNDLALMRVDMIGAITVADKGLPGPMHWGHLLPANPEGTIWRVMEPEYTYRMDMDFLEFIHSLEEEIGRSQHVRRVEDGADRAILLAVTTGPRSAVRPGLQELEDLAFSAGVSVVDSFILTRQAIDPRTFIGPGQLNDLVIRALQLGANLLIFHQNLNPSQVRSITDSTDLRVIDRTQLILDIFAQRAQSREGKLQVELAQLRYLLPRLATKNTAMSRLTGGIGGRGPGETKLEINRRRVRERIHRLEQEIQLVHQQRDQRRAQRRRDHLPVISIVGYTNAGKSTLLNTLTHSHVQVENRLFSTLDPTSRRLRFPRDFEAIITDTVGFIRDLPRDLIAAFRATLDELKEAGVLVHVIDASNPRMAEQVASVESILADLGLQQIPIIRVLNKEDLVDPLQMAQLQRQYGGIAISAMNASTLSPLIHVLEEALCRPLELAGRKGEGSMEFPPTTLA